MLDIASYPRLSYYILCKIYILFRALSTCRTEVLNVAYNRGQIDRGPYFINNFGNLHLDTECISFVHAQWVSTMLPNWHVQGNINLNNECFARKTSIFINRIFYRKKIMITIVRNFLRNCKS
ncbi:hypothetical protein PUN28_016111 [Cardiocondyla obscurior]|uniref:Uncharacterized protein n=1 Tax=Cardiocondyla obscurior TaxID=286306 RepID=A0AAW2EUM6_9HYME